MSDKQCWLLDYGAGNVRSVENAISSLGFQVHHVRTVADLAAASRVVFPGVGVFGEAVQRLRAMGLWDALIEYVRSNRPFLGICVGMQLLFEEGEESPGVRGLGIIPGRVDRFQVAEQHLSVPHIGWNGINTAVDQASESDALCSSSDVFYFVHSYRAMPTELNREWIGAVTDYGDKFISMVHRGAIFATQFHPEKSGRTGLRFLDRFLSLPLIASPNADIALLRTDSEFQAQLSATTTLLRKRIIACLDVRMNDAGDVVVTKGDQYDVRERDGANAVRNLGAPVALAERYYNEGADGTLNIFRFFATQH
jgi:glutamine amidotransferase/cyclase